MRTQLKTHFAVNREILVTNFMCNDGVSFSFSQAFSYLYVQAYSVLWLCLYHNTI